MIGIVKAAEILCVSRSTAMKYIKKYAVRRIYRQGTDGKRRLFFAREAIETLADEIIRKKNEGELL